MDPYNTGTLTITASPDPWVPWNHSYYISFSSYSSTVTDTTLYASTSGRTWNVWNNEWFNKTASSIGIYPTLSEERCQLGRLEKLQNQSIVRPASAEQKAQWRIEDEKRQRLREEEQKQLREAKKRAEELLKANLTPQQREELEQKNCFHLLIGDKKYRINRGRSRNIQLLDANSVVVKTLCAHPSEMIPDADTMLTQKLMLENAEEEFLRIANRS